MPEFQTLADCVFEFYLGSLYSANKLEVQPSFSGPRVISLVTRCGGDREERRQCLRKRLNADTEMQIALRVSEEGRGRATKEDGRLSPELRAAVAPRRRRGPCGGQKIALTNVKTLPQPRASVRTSITDRRDPTGRQRASEGKGEKWPTLRAEPRLPNQKTVSLKDGGTQPGRP
ncbi:hypothetical protein NDU88_001335 [Pleurodeles waltl]|uniref:Uncharacterized protein n=1 Tax=Pleurodeles waltl TaxID=8319 RepID=A0AAV7S8A4_PLEWA|nr:hypothetical protein NDU88_001335 [Pleurodeles waltl]